MIAEESVPAESPQVIPISNRVKKSQQASTPRQSIAPRQQVEGEIGLRRGWLWFLAACADLLCTESSFDGIPKDGQLVIESELSDGEIKIKRVDDGSEQKLKIETGNTVTSFGRVSINWNWHRAAIASRSTTGALW